MYRDFINLFFYVKIYVGDNMNERLEQLFIERVIRRQEKANESILREIGRILKEIGELKFSELYSINQQLKYGESLDKIIKTLSEIADINELEIYKMLEKSSIVNLEQSKKYYLARGIDFIPYEENIALQMQVESIARATNRIYSNIALTTGFTYLDMAGNKVTKPLQRAYWDIIDEAIFNVRQGKETFDEALKKQIKVLGESGIQSIEYTSGTHRRIDSALRMNMQDGLNQLNIKQQEIIGEQFGADGFEVTVHEYPAEDHEMIQGHMFTKEEFNKLQDFNYMGQIKDIDGNIYVRGAEEHIRPIGELHCYHRAFSVVIGVDEPRYTDKQLKEIRTKNNDGFEFEGKHYTLYDGEQLLRNIELNLRKNKDIQILGRASDNAELVGEAQTKITQLTTKYHEILKASGLRSKLDRARVAGYHRVSIEKMKKK